MKNRILIVEDSVLSRSFIKNILSEKDVVIEEAVNGIDGLEKIKSFKPDIIFLDLLMPELDGFGVLEKMKENGSDIPVITLTADIQETTRKKCFDLGVKYFLNKPVKKEKLLMIIESYLGV